MDLEINNNFELVINEKADLGVVEDQDELQQRIFTAITLFQRNVLGDLNDSNALRKIRFQTKRALEDNDLVDSVDTIDIQRVDKNTSEVFILYNQNQTISGVIE